ncbi:MAG TPA: hypothetical protein VIA06_09770 [Candidatus Dormibacteraeota bacterium]|nr:hypothetical protein [Candidatus Dormibacteraeota bacterium]
MGALVLMGLAASLGRADAQAAECTLWTPSSPASAGGLATPYRLQGDGCSETDPDFSAFVQATILDPATGALSVYDPLVVTSGTTPAAAPVVPKLPAHAVVYIATGYNGTVLRLVGPGAGAFTQGVGDSLFSQNAFYDGDWWFYRQVDALVRMRKIQVPALGTASDGLPCPTARDFSIVDQDQSDNTTASYIVTPGGQTAQDEPQNSATLGDATVFNGSDEGVLTKADAALGCAPWEVPDLADTTGTQTGASYATNEIMAAYDQPAPVATVPADDPFVLVNGQENLWKLNLYRIGVDQSILWSLNQARTRPYCTSLIDTGMPRLALDQPYTSAAPSPFPAEADTLYDFLAFRFSATLVNLNCLQILGIQQPVTLTTDSNGVVIGASYDTSVKV